MPNKCTAALIFLYLTNTLRHKFAGPMVRTKRVALYSATKSLQNSCTAKLQLFSSILEAKQQLNSSCSGMQERCAALPVYKSGTGTRGHWLRVWGLGTWGRETKDLQGTAIMGRGDAGR